LASVGEPNPEAADPFASLLTTLYRYNASGALLEACPYADSGGGCPAGALRRSFAVNPVGRVTEESHPESGTTSFTYCANGLLHTRTDARGITATHAYYGIGRPTGTPYSDQMAHFFNGQNIRHRGLKTFLTENAERIKERGVRMAEKAGRPLQHLQRKVRKEEPARTIAGRDGIKEGLICVPSVVEPCRTFSFRFGKGKPFVASTRRKCLFPCFYFMCSKERS
jgi:YD repeat-containing protein